jgi:drug/metabolite transporter (DMT)-like permease
MKGLYSNPLFLLLGTGIFLGLLLPLGRMAHEAGIDPFLWAAMISFVPGICLAVFASRQQRNVPLKTLGGFGVISGLFAYVIPNAMVFLAIPHIGSGLTGLMFALSPVVTAIISIVFRIRPPNTAMLAAVALGFVGAVIIVFTRQSLTLPSASHWLLLALIVPVSLAIGNVFRTARWPKGATPLQIGAASNLLAAPLLLLASVVNTGSLDVTSLLEHLPLALTQWLVSLAMFSLFFRLQWIGGPTYLSQIGYVAAAVSLVIGAGVLGETYPVSVWIGAGLIIAGILTLFFERRTATASL